MLSIAAVGSAAGAAGYYAADNYYTAGQLREHSAWHGRGAAEAGLDGPVGHAAFEAVLAGRMPDGSAIGQGTRGERRAGFDLTFSAPKSVSLLAYVGGDRRLLDAHLGSVKAALDWGEARLAATRMTDAPGERRSVPTGRLMAALFQHDTSRTLDPQAHVHAVVVNATRGATGPWRALDAQPLWRHRTAIASVYNASLRQAVEALGYKTETVGRHGQFEVAGVGRAAIAAFSQRRSEIVGAAQALDHRSPATMAAVALRTRGDKPAEVDRMALVARWRERAAAIGFEPGRLVAEATMRAARRPEPWRDWVAGVRGVARQARLLAQRLGLVDPRHPADALVPERPGRIDPLAWAAAQAVAAAARHLGEREAGWTRVDLVKAALDLSTPVPVAAVEARIDRLLARGLLVADGPGWMLTTAEAVARERAFLAEVARGRGGGGPLLRALDARCADAVDAAQGAMTNPGRRPAGLGARDATRHEAGGLGDDRRSGRSGDRAAPGAREPADTLGVQTRGMAPSLGTGTGDRDAAPPGAPRDAQARAVAARARALVTTEARIAGLRLTRGQLAAAQRILIGPDRVVAIQGDAGSGKSAMLAPVARLTEREGRAVVGLAVSNAIARRLGDDIKAPAMTVSRFLAANRATTQAGRSARASRERGAALKGAVLIVDEASMLATRDALELVRVANAAGVARLVLVGDARQLGAVEAGRPFADLQDRATAHMCENLRARSDVVRLVHAAAQRHDMAVLADVMAERTHETEATAREAAERWLALPPDERAATAIFVTGRALRAAVNDAVQRARAERGETAPGLSVRGALSQVHLTREEQRRAHRYAPGQVVDLARPLAAQGLPAGRMTILARDGEGRLRVRLADGRDARFAPGRLAANRVPGAVRVFEARDLELRIGDPVVWHANDPARGLVNGVRGVLAAVERSEARFLMADGAVLALPVADPLLRRLELGYALNAHAAQGATADKAILVARDVRGFDGSAVLVPRGSRLIGEYDADVRSGQNRVLVTWTRLIRPDGTTSVIASPGADSQGGGGVPGRLNTFFFQRFAGAVLQSALAAGVNYAGSRSGNSVVVAVPAQAATTASQAILPTSDFRPKITVRPGAAINVFVARDLELPPVAESR